MTRNGTKAAARAANRYRGFPLSWQVAKAGGLFARCDRSTRRKTDKHVQRWDIDSAGHRTTVCANCCTFQQGKAIEWAEKNGGRAEAFR